MQKWNCLSLQLKRDMRSFLPAACQLIVFLNSFCFMSKPGYIFSCKAWLWPYKTIKRSKPRCVQPDRIGWWRTISQRCYHQVNRYLSWVRVRSINKFIKFNPQFSTKKSIERRKMKLIYLYSDCRQLLAIINPRRLKEF